MFKHYLKTAWRSLKVNKFYSILNISGLAVGLATGIMLLLWVQNEFSYDKFNSQYEHIYHINANVLSGGKTIVWNGIPAPISVMAKNISGIKSFVRTMDNGSALLSNSNETKNINVDDVVYVDSNFLSVFDFKLSEGNEETVWPNAHSIALTQRTAKALFGTENALGKTVRFNKENFTVTAVLENFPKNSSIQTNALLPMSYYAQQFIANGGWDGAKTIDEDYATYSFSSYVLLYPKTSPALIGKKLTDIFSTSLSTNDHVNFVLQNLGNIHLIGNDGNNSALRMVQIMLLVAVLILVIASINYVNLSTARSLIRVKEVSIKKIIGAKKKQLFFQFVNETLLLFAFAIVIAVGLIFALMPLYNSISGKQLSFSLFDFDTVKILFIVIVGIMIASSIYPALLLSSFQPLAVLRGTKVAGFKTASLRKILVVLQFSVSFILLVGTMIMGKQMQYIRNKNLGYDKNYVFTVYFPDEAIKHFDAIKAMLQKETSIINLGSSDVYDFSDSRSCTMKINWKGKANNNNMIIGMVSVDKDFIPTMKLRFLEGGNFSGMAADSSKFILNETAVKQMGLKPPYVGQFIQLRKQKGTIAGVLKDFNFKPLTEQITPVIFYTSSGKDVLYVRTTGAHAQQAIDAVEKVYKKYAGKEPFNYDFMDKTFEAHYQSQRRAGTLFITFTAVAIFISCLGLFGLATYTAQVKTKEIGIRKVLGASVGNIVRLISKDFLKLVMIAVVIATPLAYWAMDKWLDNFAYKTTIGVFTFIAAAFVVLIISFGTIGFKAFKSARVNPVKSLKME